MIGGLLWYIGVVVCRVCIIGGMSVGYEAVIVKSIGKCAVCNCGISVVGFRIPLVFVDCWCW